MITSTRRLLPMHERVRLWDRAIRELVALANPTPHVTNGQPGHAAGGTATAAAYPSESARVG